MKYYLILVTLLLTACGQMKGNDGAPGIQGVTGATGATGSQGDRGPAGVNATPVYMIKLCGDEFTPSYPNTFPEYALCWNHQLWGVYSANGGFWTTLTPGHYSSNGINSRCDFTVSANCEVSQ